MPLIDRTLLGPGPSNPYPEATAALGAPLLGHLDPAFLRILDETCDRLRAVWRTENRRTLPLSGTGSIGMEAAFANTVRPGTVVVVAVNGVFGERMCDVAGRYGAEVVRVDHEWGQPVDIAAVLAAHPAPDLAAAVHAETSTGVASDIAGLAAGTVWRIGLMGHNARLDRAELVLAALRAVLA
jgi:alanine-glyoxylate transaminase/serine-glyoxylate transaminase/serine-pyruvate transaminase